MEVEGRGKLFGVVLVVISLVCLCIVAALVLAKATPIYPIALGGLAGAVLATGVIELLPLETSARSS